METLDLYTIPGYTSSCSVNPKEITDFILSHEGETMSDTHTTRYEDTLIPENEEPIKGLITDIMSQLVDVMNCDLTLLPPVWAIIHKHNYQTYPHCHNIGPYDWSVVYWSQVPEGSGHFEYYPNHNLNDYRCITPIEGNFLCIPGPLFHGVRCNKNKTEKRISLAFNVVARP